MFYVLNFKDHTFFGSSNARSIGDKVTELLNGGVSKDEVEIVNAPDDMDLRMTPDQFFENASDWM